MSQKVKIEEFQKVCKFAQLVEVNHSTTYAYKTKEGNEGIELIGGEIKTFIVKNAGKPDAEKIQDQPITSKDLLAVIGAFQEKRGEEIFNKSGSGLVKSNDSQLPEKKFKNELIIGTVSGIAQQYGIPQELANMFFMKFDDQLYIKNPGLLWLTSKKGYGHMEVSDKFNETTKEWEAEYKIYPILTKEILEAIAKMSPDVQEKALIAATKPTNGFGHAGNANIKMKTMLVFARDLAQTRAQNRAMRAYTGYGATSYEELNQEGV